MISKIYYVVILSMFTKYAVSESTRQNLFMNGPCRNYEFRCVNDKCIDRDQFCNSVNDCGDNSDEHYCFNDRICPVSYEFIRCYRRNKYGSGRRCVPAFWKCDGIIDCDGGEDESNCGIDSSRDLKYITPANVTIALTKGRNWIINQSNSERIIQKWGEELPKKVVALYLSNFTRNASLPNELIYELSLSFLSKLALKKIGDVSTPDIASYLNAFLVSCIDPRKFFVVDLVRELRKRVDAMNSKSPYALLTLCNAGEIITDTDVQNLLDVFSKANDQFKLDVQAYVIMALSCAVKQKAFDQENLSEMTLELKKKQYRNGTVENIKTTALVLQALFSSEQPDEDNFDERKAILQLIRSQNDDGSFGGISNTYYVLPVLGYASFVNISSEHCSTHHLKENEGFENLKNQPGEKWNIKYSLWIGDDKLLQRNIVLGVPTNTSFYGIMEYAADLDSKYRFEYNVRNRKPYIFSISGIMDDPETETFWTLHQLVNGETHELKSLTESPANISPKRNDHFVFWYKSLHF